MLTVEEALARCLARGLPLRVEEVPLTEAYGRVLAETVVSPIDIPRWDNSAMDGYAVRADDLSHLTGPAGGGCDLAEGGAAAPSEGVVLHIVEVIPAGSIPRRSVGSGESARIFTGAPLPEGADTIVIQEEVEALPEARVRIFGAARRGHHVRRRGEEVAAGAEVLSPGVTLSPARIGRCASVGRARLKVAAPPRVAILSTGDEVVAPGEPLGPGQLWSSNTAALIGLVREAGAVALDAGNAPDSREGTRAALLAALSLRPDLLLTTGGVSVGDFDVVKEVLADVGVEMDFWRVKMRPGKPLAVGHIGDVPVFGLPGNPVSCMVNFLQFVRPVLRRALGDPNPFLPVVDARLEGSLHKGAGRNELVRVLLSWEGAELRARPTGGQDSHLGSSMARAQGLLLLDAAARGAADGDLVPVQIIDAGFLCSPVPGYRWGGRPA